MAESLIEVSRLKTYFFAHQGRKVAKAVNGVSFSLDRGEALGLVGESGCGKTTVCLSIMRVLPPTARIIGGQVLFKGEDLLRKPSTDMRKVRGKQIGMIVQDPLVSLDPLFAIGDQVAEPVRLHQRLTGRSLWERVKELLWRVRIASPEMLMRHYPHQLSGGMRQRVVGSIALAGIPDLLIADEPTTSLDVTTQAQYLNLLEEIQKSLGLSLIFITHNLGIVAKMCDKVAVMYAGKIVELGTVRTIFYEPRHPYTIGLLKSMPKIGPKTVMQPIGGQPPDLADLPAGCAFRPRCNQRQGLCQQELPAELLHLGNGHYVSCWRFTQESGLDG